MEIKPFGKVREYEAKLFIVPNGLRVVHDGRNQEGEKNCVCLGVLECCE